MRIEGDGAHPRPESDRNVASPPSSTSIAAGRDPRARPSTRAYIALGANLGDPAAQLVEAARAIARLPGTRLAAASSLYRSAPVGYLDQPEFRNAVLAVDTTLAPRELLDALLAIEQACGRTRSFRDAPRPLDLDLLMHGEAELAQPGLELPHPRMAARAFVLQPLAEIAPDCRIPGLGPLARLLPAVASQAIERDGPLLGEDEVRGLGGARGERPVA